MSLSPPLSVPSSCATRKGAGPKSPSAAPIAQLGERQTEDLKIPGSIPGLGMLEDWECCSSWKRGPTVPDFRVRKGMEGRAGGGRGEALT